MKTSASVKQRIYQTLEALPLGSLNEVAEFLEYIKFKATTRKPGLEQRPVKLEGLWKHIPDITEEEIAEARKEMWGSLRSDL
jgi:hypothetical protein